MRVECDFFRETDCSVGEIGDISDGHTDEERFLEGGKFSCELVALWASLAHTRILAELLPRVTSLLEDVPVVVVRGERGLSRGCYKKVFFLVY
jgi:hypothetical protein